MKTSDIRPGKVGEIDGVYVLKRADAAWICFCFFTAGVCAESFERTVWWGWAVAATTYLAVALFGLRRHRLRFVAMELPEDGP